MNSGNWADLRSGRRITLRIRGVGARPWIARRRNGLARGIYNRLVAEGRFCGKQILAEVQWRPDTLIPGGAYSAFQFVFGSNPADLYVWGE